MRPTVHHTTARTPLVRRIATHLRVSDCLPVSRGFKQTQQDSHPTVIHIPLALTFDRPLSSTCGNSSTLRDPSGVLPDHAVVCCTRSASGAPTCLAPKPEPWVPISAPVTSTAALRRLLCRSCDVATSLARATVRQPRPVLMAAGAQSTLAAIRTHALSPGQFRDLCGWTRFSQRRFPRINRQVSDPTRG